MSETLTSVTAAMRAYSSSLIKNSSLSNVSGLYKDMTQKGVSEKEAQIPPLGSEMTVFNRNMDVLDISQQAYLLKSGYQQPEKEKESMPFIFKSEKKENSFLTYTPMTLTQKKENAAISSTLFNAENLLNTQNKSNTTSLINTDFTVLKTAVQQNGIKTQTQTGIKLDAFI